MLKSDTIKETERFELDVRKNKYYTEEFKKKVKVIVPRHFDTRADLGFFVRDLTYVKRSINGIIFGHTVNLLIIICKHFLRLQEVVQLVSSGIFQQ